MIKVVALLAVGVAISAIILGGPERLWSAIGPADLGSVDFATLARRKIPNDALACPPGLCKAKSDLVPPVFAINTEGLRAAMSQVIASEPRITIVHMDLVALKDRYIQRSAVFRFPDTVDVRYVEQPGQTSTLAIYSRSQLGYGDMGVNRARIERWLDKLKKLVPLAQ